MGAEVRIRSQQRLLRVPRRRMEEAVREVFRLAGRRRLLPVSLVVVDDRTIRGLHREFLGQDRATDVISFPLAGDSVTPQDPWFGEVVLSAETACREARRRGHPPTHELLLYAVHGVLHLLGWDDHGAEERAAMRDAERQVLAAVGVDRDLRVDGRAGHS